VNPIVQTVLIVNFRPSEGVLGLDFDFEPKKKCNFTTCLQVLEHISDTRSCMGKLFQIAHRVLELPRI
jgi:hypothetical protein